jgi:PBP1b-binding outer membrane lipoprotein LpoB
VGLNILTMNSATALMTSHMKAREAGHLTMNSATALMTSHNTSRKAREAELEQVSARVKQLEGVAAMIHNLSLGVSGAGP